MAVLTIMLAGVLLLFGWQLVAQSRASRQLEFAMLGCGFTVEQARSRRRLLDRLALSGMLESVERSRASIPSDFSVSVQRDFVAARLRFNWLSFGLLLLAPLANLMDGRWGIDYALLLRQLQ